jgi:hypothetical protein
MWPYDQWCLQGTSGQMLEQRKKNQREEIVLGGEAGRRLIFFFSRWPRQQGSRKQFGRARKTNKKREAGRRRPGVGDP